MTETEEHRLREAFARASVMHFAVDVENYFCEPERVKKTFKYYPLQLQGLLDVPPKIAEFSERTRGVMQQGWVVWFSNDEQKQLIGPARPEEYHKGSPAEVMRVLCGQPAQAGDLLFSKNKRSAFSEALMDEELKRRGIDTLVLSGVFREQCVLETAADGVKNGYNVYVMEDLSVPAKASRDECRARLQSEGVVIAESAQVLKLAGIG